MEDISMRGAVVRISQDSMEAYLTLQPPEAGEGYTLSELVRYIRTQRVTNGIDEAAIQEMIDGGGYMGDVCIAKGQPPVNAENGRYELHFNPDVDGKPKVKEDGSIDYWSIRTVEMVKEGHAIGNHGYCHNYSILYPGRVADTTAFINDMEKSENVMKSVLGDDFSTKVIRFPGGHMSWKTGNLDPVLEQHGYTYIDWNVLNGDAEGNGKTVEQLINRLKETITNLCGNDDVLVVLMHDTDAKPTTAESLQQSIDYLKSLGYEFRTLK